MKKILVTGAGGFIGSHLVEACVENGFSVRAFVHYNSNSDWGWLEGSPVKKQIEVVAGDIRDYDSVFTAMQGCSSVFHLAALIGIPYSYVSPLAYLKTNVEGTYNVLQSARILNFEQVLITSTSETYGTAQYVPIDEKHPLVGQSPYSASKIAADQIAISFFRSFNLPVKIVRPFNTFGPRQSARAIIPTIVAQILSGAQQIKLGNVHPTRDLVFVKDTVQGFLSIYKSRKAVGEIINVGCNDEVSIGDLASRISRIMDIKIKVVSDSLRVRPSASEVERLRCNDQKMLSLTSWKPAYTLDQGLKETVEFIRAHIHLYKPEIYNV